MFDNVTKVYSDKEYKYTAMVRHKGVVLAFAMSAGRRLFYTVLDLSRSTPQAPLDVNYWLENPRELRFTNEIAQVGYGVADQTTLPVVKLGSRAPVPPGIRVRDEERDAFLSTTARLTADAPFHVLSDGKHVFLFRQAVTATHPDNVVSSGVPMVDATLLVDRFVMVGTELKPKMEVRYQRSRSKFRPQNRKDSLNAKDMEGQPFFEPTQELSFVRNLTHGRFTVLMIPTQVVDVRRWQIFAHNSRTGFMESYNLERAADGLFNTQGTRFYTCSDHNDVFELRPGTCVEPRVGNETMPCDKDLIPVASTSGHAESALKLQSGNVVRLDKAIAASDPRTIEYWLFPTDAAAATFGKYPLKANKWNHLAVTLAGGQERLYLDGTPSPVPAGDALAITDTLVKDFAGVVDEVRLWAYARSGRDIRAAMNQRLTGLEPGLAAYWRFDEATGETINDQANGGNTAKHEGGEWVASDAPVGENPGINRDRLRLAGRDIASGPTALLYYQQEPVEGGYDGQAKPLKQKARVMLAVATRGDTPNENKIAALDFGVSREGKLAQTPDVVELTASTASDSSGSMNKELDQLGGLETQVRQLEADLVVIGQSIAAHATALTLVDEALNRDVVRLGLLSGDLSRVETILRRFQQSGLDISRLSTLQRNLNNALQTARVTVYEHAGYRGRALTLAPGRVGYTALNAHGFNDLISSIWIPEPLQVVVYEHANFEGASRTFDTSATYVDDNWNDRISSMHIQTSVAFAARISAAETGLAAAQTNRNTAQNELVRERTSLQARKQSLEQERRNKENLLTTKRAELRSVNARLNGDVTVPMSLLHIDPQGLTVTGRLLDFAYTSDTPHLFDSATGNLALYFRGLKNQFFVAYYDTQSRRAEYKLATEDGTIVCRARSGESEMDALRITVSGDVDEATCTVVIEGISGITETWQRVPRAAERFAGVLNGLAGARQFVGMADAASGQVTELRVPAGVARAIEPGTTLFAGATRLVTVAAVAKGATAIPAEHVALDIAAGAAVFLVPYDYTANARSTRFLADLAGGSMLVRAYAAGARGNISVTHKDAEGNVQSGQRATSGTTLSCQWRGRPPGRTLAFDGNQRFARLIQKTDVAKFDAPGDVTMELWCRPGSIDDKARLIQQRSGNSDYMVGLRLRYRYSAIDLNFKPPEGIIWQKSFIQIPSSQALSFEGAITLEAWIMPKSLAGTQYIVYHAIKPVGRVFLRIRDDRYEVGSAGANGVETFASAAAVASDADTWTHLSGVYDDAAKRWLLFRNGVEIARADSTTGALKLNDSWVFGARADTAATAGTGLLDPAHATDPFVGRMDEVRIWNLARSRDDIDADRKRPLRGNDLGLVGCWRFYNAVASDHSVYRNDGRVLGNIWGNNASVLPCYAVFAAVGGQVIETRETIPGGNWSHLAAVFNQSYALRFDGKHGDYLDCGNDVTLDLNRDLTIEVFLQPDPLRRPLGILAKGVLADGSNKQDVPYQLALDSDGMLMFAFEDTDHAKHIIATAEAVPPGFCKLAATRRHVVESVDDAIVTYDEIGLYINGKQAKLKMHDSKAPGDELGRDGKAYKYKGKSAGSNTLPLEIGRAHLAGAQESMFKGVISEVRLWNAAREAKDVCGEINGSEKGLVSWWRMQENDGNTATDSKSTNHARIKGNVEWLKNPDPNGSQLTLYLNGVNAPQLSQKKEDLVVAENQFALGALDNAIATEKFQGEMEEVRIWKTPRTAEQIQDNLFRRLTGEKEDLIAHYTFDVAPNEVGTVAATQGQVSSLSVPARVRRDLRADTILWLGGTRVTVSQDVNADADAIPIRKARVDVPDGTPIFEMTVPDHALRGNHLQLSAQPSDATFVLSTAPVTEDAPQIRSALAGIKTDFNDTVHGRPAVEEYGEMQYDVEGNLIGVLKRCYGIVKDGQWQIITAYKVGDLLTEWVGQVQFAPQLMGYIEGAPPVPSENLTTRSVEAIGDQDDYNEASVVEIVEAKRTTYTYSAEKEAGYDLSLDLSARAGIKSESLGGPVVAITSLEDTDIKFGLKSGMEYSQSWLKDASTSVGKTVSRSSSLELRGRFETPQEAADRALGRRFIPENVGLALVQSETADVFALRLQSNNALISYQMRPNPDIPKDWNIITFPINPRYTKQGTLDGKIGFRPDPNYPNALTYSPDSSYFKPIEAYALKNRIQRDEEELRTFYEQFSPAADVTQIGGMAAAAGAIVAITGGMSGGIGPAVAGGGLGYLANEKANTTVDSLPRLEKRNIVNTYVWTADGGLFAETQETMDVWQETTGGSFNASAKAGLSFSAEGALSKVAYEFELEASLGAHLNLTLKKSEETENTFAVNVTLGKVERDIYERDEKGFARLDQTDPRNPKPIKTPGKVDAYRFMTFYLEPRTDNFDLFFNRVVDPIWLEQSDDPNAVALREARQDAFKPPCWRVMHRVTYVSRTLQPLADAPASALDKAMQDLNVASNYELIKVLEPFVRDKRGFVAFADAVRQALRTYLPELVPHAETIVTYASLYFGVIDDEGIGASDSAALGTPSASPPGSRMDIEAGADQVVRMEQGAALLGEVANATADVPTRWSMVSGPDAITFDDATARATVAHFRKRGVYRLRLTATNAAGSIADELTVVVNEAPVIEAGPNQVANLNGKAQLVGVVSDSGLGSTGRVTTRWEMVSGPAAAKFERADALATLVTFDKSGSYLLRLTADNGTHSTSDDIVVNVVGRVVDGLRALYAFEDGDGNVIRDTSGVDLPLDLSIGDRNAVTRVDGGLRIDSPTILASSLPAGKVIDAVRTSGELTIEAWLKPGRNANGNLGRIATISDGQAGRNFMLGQGDGQFYAGLRTTTTDLNASNKALTGNVSASDELAHLVCTREASGQTRLYLNAVEIAARKVAGDFSNWDAGLKLTLGGELPEPNAQQSRHAWLGEYHLLALYSRALRPEEIRQNFAFQADTNLAPAVEAGADQVIDLPATAQLHGSANDDRLQSDTMRIRWAKLSGPGGVTFATPTALNTTADFARSGVYTLQLTVADEELSNSDTVTVVVHQAPTIKAGVTPPQADQPLLLTETSITATIEGTIISTGLAETGQGQVSVAWEKLSGPGTVKFEDARAPNTRVTFTKHGAYTLRLTANNGRLTGSSEVSLRVVQPATVSAGADQIINLPASAKLKGAIKDSGTDDPQTELTVQWTASGPGAVTFSDPKQLVTTASFARNGTYVLRLEVGNGHLSAGDELTVVANQPPVVDTGPDREVPAHEAELEGIVSDDGLPEPPGAVTLLWERVSGPGEVWFSDPTSAFTRATFAAKGAYTLRLTADDGVARTSDDVDLTVHAAPSIWAGDDQTVTRRDAVVTLEGVVSDDGLVPPRKAKVTTRWTQTGGPGPAIIADESALTTTVSFTDRGTYVFELSASNGLLASADQVEIKVRGGGGQRKPG